MSSPSSPKAASFGRRGMVLGSATPYARRKPHPSQAQVEGRTLVVHYNWKVAALGVSFLVMATKFASMQGGVAASLPDEQGKPHMVGGFGMFGDHTPMVCAIAVALMGLGWISRVVSRSPALTLSPSGVTGFTLLGTKTIRWEDVERVQIDFHAVYKAQVTIHGIWGSKSVGWLGVTGIPVKIAVVDQPLSAIVASIRSFKPDVQVVTSPLNGLLKLISQVSEKLAH